MYVTLHVEIDPKQQVDPTCSIPDHHQLDPDPHLPIPTKQSILKVYPHLSGKTVHVNLYILKKTTLILPAYPEVQSFLRIKRATSETIFF